MDVQPVERLISEVLHGLVFFEEFAFAKNKFKPPDGTELEFADAVVALDDVLLVMQIKERYITRPTNQVVESNWFDRKVVRTGTRQVRDTLRYLEARSEITLPNERGRLFNIAAGRYSEIIKFIVYRGSNSLPDDKRMKKFHRSNEGGFIHLIEAGDYLNTAKVLRVPEELIRYFRYRERMLTTFEAECAALPEASLVGGYVGGTDDRPPNFESFRNLHRLTPDEETWDISPYLRTLRDHTSDPKYNDDYYSILTEFVRLPRSMWRLFKERLVLCIENAAHDKFSLPYRFADPARDVGFMLFAPDSSFTKREDWPDHRIQGLINFTALNKFDQKLKKCIGVQVAKDGQDFDIQWCMIVGEWVDDPDIRKKLDASSPFRPVRTQNQFSYFLVD